MGRRPESRRFFMPHLVRLAPLFHASLGGLPHCSKVDSILPQKLNEKFTSEVDALVSLGMGIDSGT